MKIIIKDKVREYLKLREKNNLTIDLEDPRGCWEPVPEIFVRPREPEASENYNVYELDGIKVYIYKGAKTKDVLTIKMSERVSDLADKEIEVEGIDIM